MAVQMFMDQEPTRERTSESRSMEYRFNDYRVTTSVGSKWDEKLEDLPDEKERETWLINHMKLHKEAVYEPDEFGEAFDRLYAAIFENEVGDGVEAELKETEYIHLDTFAFRWKMKLETFYNKISKWSKQMSPGNLTDPKKIAAKREEVMGKIRAYIQSKMKQRSRVVLFSGEYWEYYQLYEDWIKEKMEEHGSEEERLQQEADPQQKQLT